MGYQKKFTDPKDESGREYVAASAVEATRFRAMGYKEVQEKKTNKASAPAANKSSE